jgi:thiosulfate/3-mercaptopyruvate sulfurtransferase
MPVSYSILLGALTVVAIPFQTRGYPQGKMLIEVRELNPGKVLVLDARKTEEYEKDHIPGAVRVDVDGWKKAFAASQDPHHWAKRLGTVGIDGKTPVVIYDENRFLDAARIWYIVRFWGIDDVRLLNGGWKAWLASGGKQEKQISRRDASPAIKANGERLATKQKVLEVLKGKSEQILDARSFGEFCGTTSKAKRGGAIPAATHLEWSDVLDQKTHRFKNAEELTKLFKDAGVDLNKPTVTYCQSGGRASVLAFALELMGGRQVRNYYRSWAEWGNDPDTPIMKKE